MQLLADGSVEFAAGMQLLAYVLEEPVAAVQLLAAGSVEFAAGMKLLADGLVEFVAY